MAQLITEQIRLPQVQEVEKLDDTGRGEQGFGSTGVKLQDKFQHLLNVAI